MDKFMICRAKVEDYTKLVVCLQPQPQTVTEHDAIGWTLNRCPQEIGEGKGQHTHGQWGFATIATSWDRLSIVQDTFCLFSALAIK